MSTTPSQAAPIGSMLCSRQLPATHPSAAPNAGCFDYETTYSGNVGNDMGISTMGYRSARFNYPEWHETMYTKYYQSFADRDNAERVYNAASDVIKEADSQARVTQAETTKRLAERLRDLHFWRAELEREIVDTSGEIDLQLADKKRLERSLRATESVLHMTTDNLVSRNGREGVDLTQDDVELNLLKEVEIVNNVQDVLKKTIKESFEQIKQSRARKEEMEADWSDKKEADDLDTFNVQLRDDMTCKQHYAAAAKFQESESTPESWAQFSHDLIVRAEHERMSSIQLRTLINNLIDDTVRDLREQNDAVNEAFGRRIAEMEDAKAKLIENLKQVCQKIAEMERIMDELRACLLRKEETLKVGQTRLRVREGRRNVELTRDPPQYHLISEVNEIAASKDCLLQKLNESEHALKDLQDARSALEREVEIKVNSLFIDREKCLAHRSRYPTRQMQLGYV